MWQLTVLTVILILSLKFGNGFDLMWDATSEFFSFKANVIQDTSLLTTLKILPIGILSCLLCSLAISQTLKLFGFYKDEENSLIAFINAIKEQSILSFVLFIFIFEEGLFRIIPILIGSNLNINLVWLLLIFNAFFALLHMGNFDHAKNPLVILPHFCSGLVFCVIAYKFGIVSAFLVHIYYDFVLFSTDRNIKYTTKTFLITVYYGLVTFLGYWLVINNFPDLSFLASWTGPVPKALSMTYTQAIGLVLLTFGAIKCLGNVAGLDNVTFTNDSILKDKKIWLYAVLGVLFSLVVTLFSTWLITSTSSPFSQYPLITSVLISLVFIGNSTQNSLSEGAFQAFKIPVYAFSIVIYAIVGPVMAVAVILTEFIITLPDIYLVLNSEKIKS